MSPTFLAETPEVLRIELPATVMKLEQYFGSFVRLNLACATGRSMEIRFYLTDWTLWVKGKSIADSQGAVAENNPRLTTFCGEQLLEVIPADALGLWLRFSGGAAFKLTANLDEYEPEDELLIAYLDTALLKFRPMQGFQVLPPLRDEH